MKPAMSLEQAEELVHRCEDSGTRGDPECEGGRVRRGRRGRGAGAVGPRGCTGVGKHVQAVPVPGPARCGVRGSPPEREARMRKTTDPTPIDPDAPWAEPCLICGALIGAPCVDEDDGLPWGEGAIHAGRAFGAGPEDRIVAYRTGGTDDVPEIEAHVARKEKDAVNIVSIETFSNGRYTPSADPQGSLVLVAFLRRGSESEPYVEVLASFGAGYEWAVDGDRQTTWRAFAEALDDEPDGLYVLGCGWTGSGEDSDFVVFDSAVPTDEERAFISANSDFSGIKHHWAARWAGVPCSECEKPVEDHVGFEFACPSATPAAVWKEEKR